MSKKGGNLWKLQSTCTKGHYCLCKSAGFFNRSGKLT